ncbi:unnamed protein product [Rotaria sp. Silwood2]|nr:unnamed protein product [Rotaria sp. Silwood2]CAF3246974.1 unnamed protein product [Rotaria sp. Silwood2]CAF4094660.1 unnamed protein product [Rotaria sp. Silwood2]CAF4246065.1 unnamed protein product [Rotaria sp. Silwood2]
MMNQSITDDEDGNDNGNEVLDLSMKKGLPVLLSPPSSTTSSSSSSSSVISPKNGKRVLDLNTSFLSSSSSSTTTTTTTTTKGQQTNKRPLRFQCKHCDYKAPSTSLMQNHIYRHTDLTPYACAYCGHKSTTKSTIMVHIELCHPNMEVKIIENRVREQDFYRDLNSSDITKIQEPQIKKQRHSLNQYDSESAPINGVAISLKTIIDDGNELSPESDEVYGTDNFESILLPTSDILDDDNEQLTESNPFESSPTLKLKFSPPLTPTMDSLSKSVTKESDSDDDSEYLLVYNRPKQYYGSLYEPDKQYACKLCTYTTNHRPSMEDHVFVHTNEKPYKCGYCGEEIFTRYAATYHIKYKHAGMARNFIQNKADVTKYYVNRAKKEEEKNQFKLVDTRRVKVPNRNGKSVNNQSNKMDILIERPIQRERSSPPPPPPPPPPPVLSTPLPVSQPTKCSSSTPPSNNSRVPATPDYRFLLAWSYYLASQATWLSPMLQQQQQQGQSPLSLPTDPESAAKFLQAMEAAMNPLTTKQTLNNNNNNEQTKNEHNFGTNSTSAIVKDEPNES